MNSNAACWPQHHRDAQWPTLGHKQHRVVEPPANTVTFAGLVHAEGTRGNDCLHMEIHRLRALTRDLENARSAAVEQQAYTAEQRNRAVARATWYISNYDKVAEEVARAREQIAALEKEAAGLKNNTPSNSGFDGGLARKNRELGMHLAAAMKNLEHTSRRALLAEEMVQHQKNGIDALNADFCALELKYVALKKRACQPVMPPLPPPPLPRDDGNAVATLDDDGWERVKPPSSES